MADNEPKTLPKPTVWDEMFPSRFLHARELRGKDVTLPISAADREVLANDKGKEIVKGIVSFKGTTKQWPLPKVCGTALLKMFGPNPQDWVGKRVTIYPTTAHFGKEIVDAIRVRGSPDMAEAELSFMFKEGRKAPYSVRLVRTATKGQTASIPAPDPVPAPNLASVTVPANASPPHPYEAIDIEEPPPGAGVALPAA